MENKEEIVVKLLVDYMKKYNYNQRDVAEKLGVNESTVSRWLQGSGLSWKHISAIKFLTAGHDALKCVISGNDFCPFDKATSTKKYLLNKILDLTDSESDQVIEFIFHIKNGKGVSIKNLAGDTSARAG